MIKALANSLGAIIDDPAELKALVADFYKSLYASEGVTDIDRVLQHVPAKVTQQMNEALLAQYTKEEVKAAVFRCSPKSLRVRTGFLHTLISDAGTYVGTRSPRLS